VNTVSDGASLVVLGTAQDGGAPQIGHDDDPAWSNPSERRFAASLGIVDHASGKRWLIDATPDIREQLHRLSAAFPLKDGQDALAGVFLTHAHVGHYTGLMFFGKEAMGARDLPVHALPRMSEFLTRNGPWSQLVALRNVALMPMSAGAAVDIGSIRVTPFLVPHREEFSEVCGYRIEGSSRKVLFIPDIDRWEDWDAMGVRIEDEIARADVAYLDGTFYSGNELPGRDMSKVPHPLIASSMQRFSAWPKNERQKVRFIHLNWSNPARFTESAARKDIERAGFGVAEEAEIVDLS
jgi:pyrroloquinoline quinone biosynthesis protein B